MRNLGCLALGVLLLPIVLIIIGPLLVLAAVRGRQSLGPIMLNSAQYGPAGRLGALMLGLGLWLLIWGGLVWIVVNGLFPGSTITVAQVTPTLNPPLVVVPNTPAVEPAQTLELTPTDIPLPTSTPTVLVIIDPTATPDLEATLSITNALPTDTPQPSGTLVLTDTVVPLDTALLTDTEVLSDTIELANPPEPTVILMTTPATEESQPPVEATGAPTATLSLAESQTVLNKVEEANVLLRDAVVLANEENLTNLESVWRDRALEKAQSFAADVYERYAKPFDVEFKYLSVPAITRSTPDEVTVVSQEIWTYGGRTEINQEAFEFTYVLNRENGEWVITYYIFLNVPPPTTAPILTPTPILP